MCVVLIHNIMHVCAVAPLISYNNNLQESVAGKAVNMQEASVGELGVKVSLLPKPNCMVLVNSSIGLFVCKLIPAKKNNP